MLDDELYHYGVKGMRWGVRKNAGAKGFYKQNKAEYRAEKTKKFEKKFDYSTDYRMKNISNGDLQAKVIRLNLEKQYKDLTHDELYKGQRFVQYLKKDVGKKQFSQGVNAGAQHLRKQKLGF